MDNIKKEELKLCYVRSRYENDIQKGLFHRWESITTLKRIDSKIQPVVETYAVVEIEDGNTIWVESSLVRFQETIIA